MQEQNKSNSKMIFLFQKYLRNNCSKQELEELFTELRKTPSENKEIRLISYALWKAIEEKAPELCEKEKAVLRTEAMSLIHQSRKVCTGKTIRKGHSSNQSRRFMLRLAPFAAAAVFTIVIWFGAIKWFPEFSKGSAVSAPLLQSNYTTIRTKQGQIKKLQLADGSKITMNAASEVKIPADFNKEKRSIYLKGEAFFKVTKNPKKAFVVHTDKLSTTVLGTSFIVKAYEELAAVSVSVKEGRVAVAAEKKQLDVLSANKMLRYHTIHKNAIKKEINWNNQSAWLSGKLVFTNATTKELQLQLKNRYGIQLRVNSPKLHKAKFNADFQANTSLEKVLETLSLLYQCEYSLQDDEAMLYDSNKKVNE